MENLINEIIACFSLKGRKFKFETYSFDGMHHGAHKNFARTKVNFKIRNQSVCAMVVSDNMSEIFDFSIAYGKGNFKDATKEEFFEVLNGKKI